MDITAACKRLYDAYHNSGYRDVKDIEWIVMHSAENLSALSVARYFSTPESEGSAHLVIDTGNCYRMGPNTMVMWGAPGANDNGFHIEQCGYARWSTETWMSHRATLDRAAYKAAYHCKLFGIKPVFRTWFGLRLGRKGITTHAEVTKAWPKLGSHTDPGTGWPRKYFMSRVQTYYAALEL